MLGHQ
jgi:hypothetical protein